MAETRTRDKWAKIDILAKIMTPVVLFAMGTLYNMHQNRIAEAQKVADRVTSLVKSLSSDKVEEQKAALALLKYEKSKNSAAMPDEFLNNVLPALMQIAKTHKNAEVAQAAQQLARDVVSNGDPGLVTAIHQQAGSEQPRVFIHIRDEGQRSDARRIGSWLEDRGHIVPDFEKANLGPTDATEVRYFRKAEEQEANEIASLLKTWSVPDARAVYFPGFETSKLARTRTFEVWFTPNSLRQPLTNTSMQRTGSESQ